MEQLQWTLCARVLKGPSNEQKGNKSTTQGESYYFCETSPPSDDQHQGSSKPLKPHTTTIIAEMWHNISGSEDRIQGIKCVIKILLKKHLSASSGVWSFTLLQTKNRLLTIPPPPPPPPPVNSVTLNCISPMNIITYKIVTMEYYPNNPMTIK